MQPGHNALPLHIGPYTRGAWIETGTNRTRRKPEGNPKESLPTRGAWIETLPPAGKHTTWAYCHLPHGSTGDMTAAIAAIAAIAAQIERSPRDFPGIVTFYA